MDNVHVAVRLRPLIQREKQADAESHWKADRHTITQVDLGGKACRKEYVFDRVFASSETTSNVYEEIAQPIVLKAMDGINGTIFAYGQTSSGKTHTMMGNNRYPGIIPCAIQEIFENIEDTPDREFLLRVSYMELYNEALCDLLTHEKKTLQIREVDKHVFVNDLTEEIVTEVDAVIQLLKKGEARRHFGQTNMNERSSRSHTIFRVIIESRQRDHRKKSMELAVKVSHLNLVDLAGSERANETKAEGARLKEACRINQSLHQLAMVINKLSQGAEFIPFRDSKLTRILQTSLGGNAKTAIICTVTPASIDQTHSTLQFASRAKTIKNKPEVNEVLSDEAMMQRQKKEIQELKRKIMELEQQGELLEEKASLHEQQEQKIKLLEKMILVSGAAGIHSMLPSSESKKAKYKRRQTWCPGIGNSLPLLPFAKPAASAITEETSFVSGSPPLGNRSTHIASEETESDSGNSAPSGSSDDFSSKKRLRFIEEMEEMEHTQDDEERFVMQLSPQPWPNRRKRRRAQVHFAISTESDAVDAASQTEIETLDVQVEGQRREAEGMACHAARIIELEAKVEELQDELVVLSTSGHQGRAEMASEGSLTEKTRKRYEDRITELEELQCQRAVSSASTPQARAETGELLMAKEALRHHEDRVAELEAQVEELQLNLALSRSSDNRERAEMATDTFLQTEEARRQNASRITELEALIEELQSEQAMSKVSSHQERVHTGTGDASLAEEAKTHTRILELETLIEKLLVVLAVCTGASGHQERAEMTADGVLQTEEVKLTTLVKELQSCLKVARASGEMAEFHRMAEKAAEVSMKGKRQNAERIADLETLVRELQGQLAVSETLADQGRTEIVADSVLQTEETRKQNVAKIANLEALVEDLQGQLALSRVTEQQGKAEAVETLGEESRRHLDRIASLEVLVEELQDQIVASNISGNQGREDKGAEDILLPDEDKRYLSRIIELEALVEQLQTQQAPPAELAMKENADKARISELETLVEELQGKLAPTRFSDHQEKGETKADISQTEARRHTEARIAELEVIDEELQTLQSESRVSGNKARADTKIEVSLMEDAIIPYEARIAELEALVAELQTQQAAKETSREEVGVKSDVSFMEEARKQSAAKVAELEELVEELQGQLALSRVSSHQEMSEIGAQMSLGDEVRRHYETRITELEALVEESQTQQAALEMATRQSRTEPRNKDISLPDEAKQNYKARITELEAVVEELQKQAASGTAAYEAKVEVAEVSLIEEARRYSATRIAKLEALVEELQGQLALLSAPTHQASAEMVEEAKRPSEVEIAEPKALVRELQGELVASRLSCHEWMKATEAEEMSLTNKARRQNAERISELEERVEELQGQLALSRASENQGRTDSELEEISLNKETIQHYEARIAQLEALVQELQTREVATYQSMSEKMVEDATAEEAARHYKVRITELETLVEELQSRQVATHQSRSEKEVSLAAEAARHYEDRITELEALVEELQTQQVATHQSRSEKADVSLVEAANTHPDPRISELEAVVKELRCQLAASKDSSHGKAKIAEEITLADELAEEEWREKAKRTESELLGSVELCEEIMQEKSKLCGQMEELQTKYTHMENALTDKTDEVQKLRELNEFTQLEVTMAREQEVQYQNDVLVLKMQIQEQENTLATQRQEVQELQKKLGTKDKVLEAQYQQDVDELLHKLREKNQSFHALQEQNLGLNQALNQKETLVERLQQQLEESDATVQPLGQQACQEQMVPPVTRIERESQTDMADGKFTCTTPNNLIFFQAATQVTADDLGLFTGDAYTQTEVGHEKEDLEAERAIDKAVREKTEEFEAREASLKAECDSLTATISSRDQEIEVLNELIQEYEQDDRDVDDATKIQAFVQRIEQLEQQLEDATHSNAAALSLSEETKTLSSALVQAENNCKAFKENSELMQRDLEVLTEKNMLLIEDLKTAHKKYQELDTKLQDSENTWQNALKQHEQDVASQKAAWDSMEDELNGKNAQLEKSNEKMAQKHQELSEKTEELKQVGHSVSKEKEVLLQEQQRLRELAKEGESKVLELKTALALQASQSEALSNTIRDRDSEITMLRQVIEEQEQHLEAARNDFREAVTRTKELEHLVSALNQKSDADGEICRLQSILAQQGEMLEAKEDEGKELMSKIQQLESVCTTYNQKNIENSEMLANKLSEIQRFQNSLSEYADQLNAKDKIRSELETKLEELHNVIKDVEFKKCELEKAKLEEEEKVKNLENELDDLGDEFSQHKNSYADLQSEWRAQQARISSLEQLLSKQSDTTKKLQAGIENLDQKNKVLRALLDERNQRALDDEDKYCQILAKAQNLEKTNSSLEGALGKSDEELKQLHSALSTREKEFETRISEMKELFKENASQSAQEQLTNQLESTAKQNQELVSLQQRLEQYHQEKDQLLMEVAKKEQQYQNEIKNSASVILLLKAQVERLESELEGVKTLPNTSSDIARLQEKKDETQSNLEKANAKIQAKTKELKNLATLFDKLQETCSELEDEFEEEKAQHQQTKNLLQEAQSNESRLGELEKQTADIEQLRKSHKQQIAEKNLRINELETDLLRGTDPLEDKIRSLRSEVEYQQNKAQQYKKEAEKLRTRISQPGQQGSDCASSSQPPVVRRAPEATDGSGIIESCAVFAIKAENHKLSKALEKAKRELECKDLKYHEELSNKTQAEQRAKYWKDQARTLTSQLKKMPSTQTTSSSITSPLKERDTNPIVPSKRMRTEEPASRIRYTEKIPSQSQPKPSESTATAPKRDDRDWLTRAVAARDAEEEGKDDEIEKQCRTQ